MLMLCCNLICSFALAEAVLKYEISQRYPIPKSLPSVKGLTIASLKNSNAYALL